MDINQYNIPLVCICLNKEQFIAQLSSFIINEINPSNGDLTIEYKDIIGHCLANDNYKTFLNNKKDSLIYLENIVKYDSTLIDYLMSRSQYYITRNKNGFIEFNHPLTNTQLHELKKKAKISPTKEILENLNMSEDIKNRFYCPYDNAIKKTRCAARNKYRLSLTNEVVFNVYLQTLTNFVQINKGLDGFNDLIFVHKANNIKFFKKQGNVSLCGIVFGTEYIDCSVSDPILIEYFDTIKTIYPFTHFSLTNFILNLYFIFKSSNTDSHEFLNYFTFLHIEITKNTLVKKYFANCRFNEVFSTFYQDRLNSIVSGQTDLLVEFLNNINTLPDDYTQFSSFIVGFYKLFIYEKNLLNREVKKCANDYYHTKMNQIDVVSYECDPNVAKLESDEVNADIMLSL